jgi:PAS domain S-box-containing protein
MEPTNTPPQDFVASFAHQRQRLLHHAGSLLGADAPNAGPIAIAGLSQTLMTSLELLKVAEDRLHEERRVSATVSDAQARRLAHMMAMFELAPVALILTTANSTIRETNRVAAAFLGRDAYHLAGVQLSAMVPKAELDAFRDQLALALEMGTVPAWSFPIELRRSGRTIVSATVSVIDDAAIGARALYWALRPT